LLDRFVDDCGGGPDINRPAGVRERPAGAYFGDGKRFVPCCRRASLSTWLFAPLEAVTRQKKKAATTMGARGILVTGAMRLGGEARMRRIAIVMVVASAAGAASADSASQCYKYFDTMQAKIGASSTTCAELVEIEQQLAKCTQISTYPLRKDQVDKAKREKLKAFGDDAQRELESFNKDWFESGENPDGTHPDEDGPIEALAKLRAQLSRLSGCATEDKINALASVLDEADGVFKKRMADEIACRKSPKCMSDRLAPELCGLIHQREAAQKAIRIERANPGGVVDLVKLHSLGEVVQSLGEQIKQAKSDFAKAVKKPFSDALCKGMVFDDG